MSTITLSRTGQIVKEGGKSGEISMMNVDGCGFVALERRDGFVTLDEGSYTIKMELSPEHKDQDGKPRKQFRVYGHNKLGGRASILVHAAAVPGHLEGCIGPGLRSTPNGVAQSTEAMENIFSIFGGFKVGTTGDLIVMHYSEPSRASVGGTLETRGKAF